MQDTPPPQNDSFYTLTPHRILDGIEEFGIRCTGRFLFLNSMENRVVEVEIEDEQATSPRDRFRVAKFYRPGRWTKEQIQEEHRFLFDLVDAEVPVVAPLQDKDGETIRTLEPEGIFFSIFPKSGGRIPQELSNDECKQLGRLIARMHTVGAMKKFVHRPTYSVARMGRESIEFLLSGSLVPTEIHTYLSQITTPLFTITENLLRDKPTQRIHGDLHLGNILTDTQGTKLVDFDDAVTGPIAQDLWLAIPGRDEWAIKQRELLLDGYESMRHINRHDVTLIETFRTLRIIFFSAWIGRRWEDPSFQRAFPHFGTMQYWKEQLADLQEQLAILSGV